MPLLGQVASSTEAPADWRVVLHMDLTPAGAQGSYVPTSLVFEWPSRYHRVMAYFREIVSPKDSKMVAWHCY